MIEVEPRAGELEYLTTITLDGVPLDFAGVLADVTIRHGRAGYFDTASPSTCTLQLLGVDRAMTRPFKLGSLLVVNSGAPPAPRFTGRLTDATLELDALTVTAVGALRTLSGYTVGTAAYAEEQWSARVIHAFTDAGLFPILALSTGLFDPVLVARPAEPVALGTYLDELAAMLEAAVADAPNGNIIVQASGARTLSSLYHLDPAEVAYAPSWEERLPAANIVTVSYGDPSASLSVVEEAARSPALWAPSPAPIAPTFRALPDAQPLGRTRLARTAYAHWPVTAAPLLVGRRLAIGQALELSLLPPAAPFDPWTPVLEGWTDTITSNGDELTWTMELELSDPLASGLALPWNAVPPEVKWNTVDPTLAWRDALVLSDVTS